MKSKFSSSIPNIRVILETYTAEALLGLLSMAVS